MASMKINRMPSEIDLEKIRIQAHEFINAFSENTIGDMTAKIILDSDGVIDLGGWMFAYDPDADWYTIIP